MNKRTVRCIFFSILGFIQTLTNLTFAAEPTPPEGFPTPIYVSTGSKVVDGIHFDIKGKTYPDSTSQKNENIEGNDFNLTLQGFADTSNKMAPGTDLKIYMNGNPVDVQVGQLLYQGTKDFLVPGTPYVVVLAYKNFPRPYNPNPFVAVGLKEVKIDEEIKRYQEDLNNIYQQATALSQKVKTDLQDKILEISSLNQTIIDDKNTLNEKAISIKTTADNIISLNKIYKALSPEVGNNHIQTSQTALSYEEKTLNRLLEEDLKILIAQAKLAQQKLDIIARSKILFATRDEAALNALKKLLDDSALGTSPNNRSKVEEFERNIASLKNELKGLNQTLTTSDFSVDETNQKLSQYENKFDTLSKEITQFISNSKKYIHGRFAELVAEIKAYNFEQQLRNIETVLNSLRPRDNKLDREKTELSQKPAVLEATIKSIDALFSSNNNLPTIDDKISSTSQDANNLNSALVQLKADADSAKNIQDEKERQTESEKAAKLQRDRDYLKDHAPVYFNTRAKSVSPVNVKIEDLQGKSGNTQFNLKFIGPKPDPSIANVNSLPTTRDNATLETYVNTTTNTLDSGSIGILMDGDPVLLESSNQPKFKTSGTDIITIPAPQVPYILTITYSSLSNGAYQVEITDIKYDPEAEQKFNEKIQKEAEALKEMQQEAAFLEINTPIYIKSALNLDASILIIDNQLQAKTVPNEEPSGGRLAGFANENGEILSGTLFVELNDGSKATLGNGESIPTKTTTTLLYNLTLANKPYIATVSFQYLQPDSTRTYGVYIIQLKSLELDPIELANLEQKQEIARFLSENIPIYVSQKLTPPFDNKQFKLRFTPQATPYESTKTQENGIPFSGYINKTNLTLPTGSKINIYLEGNEDPIGEIPILQETGTTPITVPVSINGQPSYYQLDIKFSRNTGYVFSGEIQYLTVEIDKVNTKLEDLDKKPVNETEQTEFITNNAAIYVDLTPIKDEPDGKNSFSLKVEASPPQALKGVSPETSGIKLSGYYNLTNNVFLDNLTINIYAADQKIARANMTSLLRQDQDITLPNITLNGKNYRVILETKFIDNSPFFSFFFPRTQAPYYIIKLKHIIDISAQKEKDDKEYIQNNVPVYLDLKPQLIDSTDKKGKQVQKELKLHFTGSADPAATNIPNQKDDYTFATLANISTHKLTSGSLEIKYDGKKIPIPFKKSGTETVEIPESPIPYLVTIDYTYETSSIGQFLLNTIGLGSPTTYFVKITKVELDPKAKEAFDEKGKKPDEDYLKTHAPVYLDPNPKSLTLIDQTGQETAEKIEAKLNFQGNISRNINSSVLEANGISNQKDGANLVTYANTSTNALASGTIQVQVGDTKKSIPFKKSGTETIEIPASPLPYLVTVAFSYQASSFLGLGTTPSAYLVKISNIEFEPKAKKLFDEKIARQEKDRIEFIKNNAAVYVDQSSIQDEPNYVTSFSLRTKGPTPKLIQGVEAIKSNSKLEAYYDLATLKLLDNATIDLYLGDQKLTHATLPTLLRQNQEIVLPNATASNGKVYKAIIESTFTDNSTLLSSPESLYNTLWEREIKPSYYIIKLKKVIDVKAQQLIDERDFLKTNVPVLLGTKPFSSPPDPKIEERQGTANFNLKFKIETPNVSPDLANSANTATNTLNFGHISIETNNLLNGKTTTATKAIPFKKSGTETIEIPTTPVPYLVTVKYSYNTPNWIKDIVGLGTPSSYNVEITKVEYEPKAKKAFDEGIQNSENAQEKAQLLGEVQKLLQSISTQLEIPLKAVTPVNQNSANLETLAKLQKAISDLKNPLTKLVLDLVDFNFDLNKDTTKDTLPGYPAKIDQLKIDIKNFDTNNKALNLKDSQQEDIDKEKARLLRETQAHLQSISTQLETPLNAAIPVNKDPDNLKEHGRLQTEISNLKNPLTKLIQDLGDPNFDLTKDTTKDTLLGYSARITKLATDITNFDTNNKALNLKDATEQDIAKEKARLLGESQALLQSISIQLETSLKAITPINPQKANLDELDKLRKTISDLKSGVTGFILNLEDPDFDIIKNNSANTLSEFQKQIQPLEQRIDAFSKENERLNNADLITNEKEELLKQAQELLQSISDKLETPLNAAIPVNKDTDNLKEHGRLQTEISNLKNPLTKFTQDLKDPNFDLTKDTTKDTLPDYPAKITKLATDITNFDTNNKALNLKDATEQDIAKEKTRLLGESQALLKSISDKLETPLNAAIPVNKDTDNLKEHGRLQTEISNLKNPLTKLIQDLGDPNFDLTKDTTKDALPDYPAKITKLATDITNFDTNNKALNLKDAEQQDIDKGKALLLGESQALLNSISTKLETPLKNITDTTLINPQKDNLATLAKLQKEISDLKSAVTGFILNLENPNFDIIKNNANKTFTEYQKQIQPLEQRIDAFSKENDRLNKVDLIAEEKNQLKTSITEIRDSIDNDLEAPLNRITNLNQDSENLKELQRLRKEIADLRLPLRDISAKMGDSDFKLDNAKATIAASRQKINELKPKIDAFNTKNTFLNQEQKKANLLEQLNSLLGSISSNLETPLNEDPINKEAKNFSEYNRLKTEIDGLKTPLGTTIHNISDPTFITNAENILKTYPIKISNLKKEIERFTKGNKALNALDEAKKAAEEARLKAEKEAKERLEKAQRTQEQRNLNSLKNNPAIYVKTTPRPFNSLNFSINITQNEEKNPILKREASDFQFSGYADATGAYKGRLEVTIDNFIKAVDKEKQKIVKLPKNASVKIKSTDFKGTPYILTLNVSFKQEPDFLNTTLLPITSANTPNFYLIEITDIKIDHEEVKRQADKIRKAEEVERLKQEKLLKEAQEKARKETEAIDLAFIKTHPPIYLNTATIDEAKLNFENNTEGKKSILPGQINGQTFAGYATPSGNLFTGELALRVRDYTSMIASVSSKLSPPQKNIAINSGNINFQAKVKIELLNITPNTILKTSPVKAYFIEIIPGSIKITEQGKPAGSKTKEDLFREFFRLHH